MAKQKSHDFKNAEKRILISAEVAFATYGFDGASIRLISKKSGVNVSMIGYYFGSKENLYLNIFKQRLKEVIEEIQYFEKFQCSPAEKLKAYLAAYMKRVSGRRNFHRLLHHELISDRHPAIVAELSATRQHLHTFLQNIIHAGIEEGCFGQIDASLLTLNILALIRAVFIDRLTCIHLPESTENDLSRITMDYVLSLLRVNDHYPSKTNHEQVHS